METTKILPENLGLHGFLKNKVKYDFSLHNLSPIEEFIRNNLKQKSGINRKYSSNQLRQIVGVKIGRNISNGEFIAAMILAGYRHVALLHNAYFNVSNESIHKTYRI